MNSKHFIRRFLAFLIDWNVMFGVTLAILSLGTLKDPDFLLRPSFETLFSLDFFLGILWAPIYCLLKDCIFNGRSLGKLICGLTIVSSETGTRAPISSLIMRNLTYVIIQIELVVTLANKGKRLGDLIAKTEVVRRSK